MENIRGAFLLDGEWIPNQFTIQGMSRLLRIAFQNKVGYAQWQVGLCSVNPADVLGITNIGEPTVGVNGYARQALAQTDVDWPIVSAINGESYVESKDITFTATGAYDALVSRFVLLAPSIPVNPYTPLITWAISSAFPDGPRTINANLTTKYRLYFR